MAAEINADPLRQSDIVTTGDVAGPGSGLARPDKDAAGLQDSGAQKPPTLPSAFNPSRTPTEEEPPAQVQPRAMSAFEEASNAIREGAKQPRMDVDIEAVEAFARNPDS
jgi:hypothetical protein